MEGIFLFFIFDFMTDNICVYLYGMMQCFDFQKETTTPAHSRELQFWLTEEDHNLIYALCSDCQDN